MLKLIVIILTLFQTIVGYSDDNNSPCPRLEIGSDKLNESLLGCDAAVIGLELNSNEVAEYKKKLNQKFAKMIATQTTQIMQDLGSSSAFFEKDGGSFLMGGSEGVEKSCKFDYIAKLEKDGCGGKTSPEASEKMRMITQELGNNSSSKSLWESVTQVYGAGKYGNNFNDRSGEKQCPLSNSAYPLNSQITEDSAKAIIKDIQSPAIDEINQEMKYLNSPLLVMISEANKTTPGFKEKFEKYIALFDSQKSTAHKYFTDFFKSKENIAVFSKGVARRCDLLNANINRFICEPLSQMAAMEPATSKKLFDKYNPKVEYQDQQKLPNAYISYGYQCLAKSKNKSEPLLMSSVSSKINNNDCLSSKIAENTVDNWYRCFNDGVRKKSTNNESDKVKNFCDHYLCKSPELLATTSCKNGGPVSSTDLNILLSSDSSIASEIEYIKSLENHERNRQSFQLADTKESLGDKKSPISARAPVLSAFDLNAFGAETVMKFAKLPKTKEITKMVENEVAMKSITPSPKEEIQKIVTTDFANPSVHTNNPASVNPSSPISSPQNYASNTGTTTSNWISAQSAHTNNTTATPHTDATQNGAEEKQMVSDLKEIMKSQNELLEKSNSVHAREKSAPAPERSLASNNFDAAALNSWAWQLKRKEAALDDRARDADERDAKYWRQVNLAPRTSAASTTEKAAADKVPVVSNSMQASGTAASAKDNNGSSGLKLRGESAALGMNASSSGLIVTPENLKEMEMVDLKNLRVNINEPFLISVKLKNKLVHVRVAKLTTKGKTFLVPRLNEDNKEIKDAILESPVFKEFRKYFEKDSTLFI